YILQDLTGNRKIFPVFLYGGLAGGLAFILSYNFLPALKGQLAISTALGASAGVMAIAVAATFIAPGYRIFPMLNGGIRLWIITAIYLIIDLATIPGGNPGGHIAHLAGAATGFLYMYFFRMGHDWGEWMNNFWDWLTNLFNPDKPKKGKKLIKEELFYKATTKPYKKTPNVTAQKVDEILDKISQEGYDSLSDEEKDLLKRASQDDV
ncbi:MAG TPA: rhomboid family intramembrane serine protease, partial [Chitinophagaceae bacterium]|nr:rhomboid family intramembrane serine protease [Chitinophagaceae bacterium]